MIDGIFDLSLLTTISFVLGATLLNKTIGLRRRDVCLKAFEGFNVTIELENGKKVWGDLELEQTGLELRYRKSVKDDNHTESGYILYESEYGQIRTIKRHLDILSKDNRRKRNTDLRRSFHPNYLRKLLRAIRRYIAVTSSSLSELLNLFIGKIRRPAGRFISDHSQNHIHSLGNTVIGHVGYAHDPLLEKFIGQRVVIEILENGKDGEEEVHELVGVFKNYSPDFIEILQIDTPQDSQFTLCSTEEYVTKYFTASITNLELSLRNLDKRPILLLAVGKGEEEQLLNLLVEPGETVAVVLSEKREKYKVYIQTVAEIDLVVPRTRCVVRHRVESFMPSQLHDMIFDIGTVLNNGSILMQKEKRLRDALEKNPNSAIAASNLGALLMRLGEFQESEKWLHVADQKKHLLPDRGKRVEMLLRVLQRKENSNRNEIKNDKNLESPFSEILNMFDLAG